MLPPRPIHQSIPERRSSYRCPVGGARRQGHLQIGKRSLAVQVLDESVGGFAIALDETPDCQIGAKLLLEIASTWVEVRAISIESLDRPSEESQEDDGKTYTRLGLLRLRDLDPWEIETEAPCRWSWDGFKSMLVPLAPLKSTFRGTVVMIVAVIAAGLALVFGLESTAPLAETLRDDMHKAAADARAARDPLISAAAKQPSAAKPARSRPPVEAKTGATTSPDESKSDPDEAKPKPTVEFAKAQETIPEKVLRLAQPAFVLKPEVTRLLSLSRQQRDALGRLFEEFRAAAVTVPGASGSESSRDRLVALGRRVLEILSAEQRRVLLELLAKMDASPDSTSPSAPLTPASGATPTGPDQPAGE